MRPLLIASTLAAATLLAGCEVPSAAERARLNGLIGHPEVDLLRNYGVPTRTYGANGHTFLAYDSSYSTYDPGFGPYGFGPYGGFGGFGGFGYGGFGPYGGFGGAFGGGFVENYTCATTFEVDSGRVSAWSLHGDGCT